MKRGFEAPESRAPYTKRRDSEDEDDDEEEEECSDVGPRRSKPQDALRVLMTMSHRSHQSSAPASSLSETPRVRAQCSSCSGAFVVGDEGSSCAFCERPVCSNCALLCGVCGGTFCPLCASAVYDTRAVRHASAARCLSCAHC